MNKLHADTFKFLDKLKKNNSRDWFAENKPWFKEIEGKFKVFMQSVGYGISEFDKTIENAVDDPKTVKVFRIYRDLRFSKDKTPYKENLAGEVSLKGKEVNYPTYYLHLQQDSCFIGGGIYQPNSTTLKLIRQYVHNNYNDLNNILESKEFKSEFKGLSQEDKLKRNPRGYEDTHPAIDLLKNKHFIVSKAISDNEAISEDFLDKVIEIFSTLYKLNSFLEKAIKN